MEIMHIEKCYIAIKETNHQVIKKLLKYINTYPNIKIYSLEDAYPCGYERNLVNTILELNYDRYPLEVGAIVNNVSTIYSIYELLKYHKPPVERIVTITGPGIKKPANYKLRIGTNFNEVMMKTSGYNKMKNPLLIAGGAMMGSPIPTDELIITKDLGCIVVMDYEKPETSPCIKCGKCSEVCPVNLIPSMIMNNPDKAKELKIDKCVSCGLCSYVCPAKIEVRNIINNIKEELKK